MPTIVDRTLEECAGPGVEDLPRLPAVITVPGADMRFTAESYYKFPDGTLMSSWDDVYTPGGVHKLTPEGTGVAGATKPMLTRIAGHRALSFDGISNLIGANYGIQEGYTFTIVAYMPEQLLNRFLATTIDSATTFRGLGVEASGLIKWWGNGLVTGPQLTPGWHIITVVADGLNTKIRLDDVTTGGATLNTTQMNRNKFVLGGSIHSAANRARFYAAEVINYPRALTDAEIEKIHTSYKLRYDLEEIQP